MIQTTGKGQGLLDQPPDPLTDLQGKAARRGWTVKQGPRGVALFGPKGLVAGSQCDLTIDDALALIGTPEIR